METSSALLHPVRLRIVQSLLGEAELTTHQLHERLPDIPIATLYRHVGHLVVHELLEVAEERQIRGASERTYRLAPGISNPTAEELKSLSSEELLTAFTVFTSGLVRDFGDYLRQADRELFADRVSFAQASFWASDEEVDEFGRALMGALEAMLTNEPSQHRRRRTLTTVLMPRDNVGTEAAADEAELA
ncbi:DNA-binding transcriptional ArsR family regulator [Microbacterium keratanolyticum]|uniref:Transcriptional regulator n=1 Tax=Microbacterium keratanolyticum TaxID=67574 RepID=A0A9W6HQ46_9MICO|nr:helix-turn-helix domain-containing protein [Microbacterium keratanolyticum]MBM7468775.1 DNA-binding transcriptional ArsR family regulator [Microbacterium keratanolyticum]GLK00851.1 transcriptional regulator [Microbacterium keratanolyticum]